MEKDPATEKNKMAMEQIWVQVPKAVNLPAGVKGEYILYIQTDPKYLYLTGFVDDKRYTEEEWTAAFEECKQSNGTYLISKEQFLNLGKYKYSGTIKTPLDPMKIREGWYDLNAWHEFCVKSIIPSTTLTPEHLIQAEKSMKENGQIVKGRIFIDKAIKLRIKGIIDNFPSPARRRELSIEAINQKRVETEATRSTKAPTAKTTFQRGQKLGEKQKKDLKETLLKASKISPSEKPESLTVSVKDLRKTSKTKKQTL